MKSQPRRQAGFYGQALLIALPIMILSAIALYSLRLDRAAIEQDARERAQELAPELAQLMGQNLSRELHDLPDRLPQGLIIKGQILFPVDYPRLPAPPDWPAQLQFGQMKLWRTAGEALFQKRDPGTARNALAAMKTAGLPEAAMANVEFGLLLLESGKGSPADLVRRLTDLAHRYPKVCTESGTPLADLALIRALHHTPEGSMPGSLEGELSGRVRSYPSFLTPELLEAASRVHRGVHSLQKDRWLADEEARALLRTLIQQPMDPKSPSEIWFEARGQQYLALCSPAFYPGTHVLLVPARRIEELFRSALPPGSGRLPPYAGMIIQMGTRRWSISDGAAPGQAADQPAGEVLASAPGRLSVIEVVGLPVAALRDTLSKLAPETVRQIQGWPNNADIQTLSPTPFGTVQSFTFSLTLAKPDLLYAGYRQRLWLIAGLILSATAAAGIGIAGAWRAFQRQVRLADMTSNFVSSVSHELRAPLASVRLMAESLDQDRITDNEKRKDYFRLIVQECRRLSSLVENVLDFSRIHQGRKRYEFDPVDLTAMVRQTVNLMEPNAAERNVSLVYSEPDSEGELHQPCWDGQAIQQALVNLIDNAIKHSPPETIVKVAWKVAEGGTGPRIHLAVEDQGPGIPVEEQERIFEPFYRRGSELHRETKGVGIGLSLVKHIAEAHGGGVSVESIVGQGSRFTLQLPVRMEQDGHEPKRK